MIRPTELSARFYGPYYIDAFAKLCDKLKKNGAYVGGGYEGPHPDDYDQESPRLAAGVLLQRSYDDPNGPNRLGVEYKRVRVVPYEDGNKGSEPIEIDDYQDLGKVTQYARAFLQAHGLLLKAPDPIADKADAEEFLMDYASWSKMVSSKMFPRDFIKKSPVPTPKMISVPAHIFS